MTNVIKMQRYVGIVRLESGDLLANEYSTYGLNVPNETFEQYNKRMDYHEAKIEPRYPMPAIPLKVLLSSHCVSIINHRTQYDGIEYWREQC